MLKVGISGLVPGQEESCVAPGSELYPQFAFFL